MLGNETLQATVAGIGVVDNNITVLINSQPINSAPHGILFKLHSLSGIEVEERSEFKGSSMWNDNLKALDLFTSHQGALVFVKISETIHLNRCLYECMIYNKGMSYAILHFDLKNYFTNAFIYTDIDSLDITMRNAFSKVRSPNMVLISGNDTIAMADSIISNLFVPINDDNCVLMSSASKHCLQCADAHFLNFSKNYLCVSSCPFGADHTNQYCKQEETECSIDEYGNPSCGCSDRNEKYTRGKCTKECPEGYRAVYNNTCVKKCPDGSIMTSDGMLEGDNKGFNMNWVMKFDTNKTGLQVPAPWWINDNNFPDEWTVSMWVQLNHTSGTQNLVDILDFVKLKRMNQNQGEGKGYVVLEIGTRSVVPVDSALINSDVLRDNNWTYIGISKGVDINTDGVEVMIVNMYIKSLKENSKPLIFQLLPSNNFPNVAPLHLQPYIVLGGNMSSKGELTSVGSLAGYLLEFKFIARYMTIDVLESHMNHSFAPDSPDIISYWRLSSSTIKKQFSDLRNESLMITLGSDYPKLIERTTTYNDATSLSPVLDITIKEWKRIYTCEPFPLPKQNSINIIKDSTAGHHSELFPTIAASSLIYENATELSLEDNGILTPGDFLYATQGDCYLGFNQTVALKTIKLERDKILTAKDSFKHFENLLSGNSYRLCYRSLKHLTTHFLHWIYVARAPEGSIPKSILVYRQWGEAINNANFQTFGGDDSIDSVIYIAKSISDVKSHCYGKIKEINNKLSLPSEKECAAVGPKHILSSDGTFSYSATLTRLDTGRHSLYWQPLYSSFYNHFVEIPNATLMKYWSAPVYISNSFFNLIELGFSDNQLYYQGEFYTLSFEVEDIKEGDQVSFRPIYTDEDSINDEVLKSNIAPHSLKIFTFTRGAFPQIYISKDFLFKDKVDPAFKRIELLFRPKTKEDESISFEFNRFPWSYSI